ncbi:MAG: hypothetical protein M0R20_07825, partial [Candidatus Omnitrophica bacterium]|nr:hypothetical protein [Candidatus Omnitrophota bacterium]
IAGKLPKDLEANPNSVLYLFPYDKIKNILMSSSKYNFHNPQIRINRRQTPAVEPQYMQTLGVAQYQDEFITFSLHDQSMGVMAYISIHIDTTKRLAIFRFWIAERLRLRGVGRSWFTDILTPYLLSLGVSRAYSYWMCEDSEGYKEMLESLGFITDSELCPQDSILCYWGEKRIASSAVRGEKKSHRANHSVSLKTGHPAPADNKTLSSSVESKKLFIRDRRGIGIPARIKVGVGQKEFGELLKGWGIFDVPGNPCNFRRDVLIGPGKDMRGFIEYHIVGQDCPLQEIQNMWHSDGMPIDFPDGAIYISYIESAPDKKYGKSAIGLLNYAIRKSLKNGGKGVVAGRNIANHFWSKATGCSLYYCVSRKGSKGKTFWVKKMPFQKDFTGDGLRVEGELAVFSPEGAKQFTSRYSRFQKALSSKP